MERITLLLALLTTVSVAAALPPLDDAQRVQLESAEDRAPRLDEGAWYPLMENAAQWPEGEQAGAAVPDYEAIRSAPAAHRGALFLIEGTLARSRRFGVARAGPWGESLTEWVVIVGNAPGASATVPDGSEEVAVVYLVDPEDRFLDTRPGAEIRAVARFYKLWGDRDAAGRPETYMTFVGRAVAVATGAADAAGRGGSAGALVLPLLLVVVVGYVLARRAGRGRAAARRGGRAAIAGNGTGGGDGLPADPAAALEELERRSQT